MDNWIEIMPESNLPIKGQYFAFYKKEKKVTAIDFDPDNTIDRNLFKKFFSHYQKIEPPKPPEINNPRSNKKNIMSENLKAENLAKAIRLLPNAKTYQPATVTVMVGKLKYTFEKTKNEWYYKF